MILAARFLAVTVVGLQACSQEAEFVYVPAENYVTSVEIALPAQARAGEWVVLSAQRRSGTWKRVRRADVPPGFVAFGSPPAEFEAEVADNLFWMTEPSGARFGMPDGRSHQRRVQFPKPGTFQVWARSAYPTNGKSNVVAVRGRVALPVPATRSAVYLRVRQRNGHMAWASPVFVNYR